MLNNGDNKNYWEAVGVVELDPLLDFKYCPYCGSNLMDVYLGDFHGYTNCSDCDESLDIDIRNVRNGKILERRDFRHGH